MALMTTNILPTQTYPFGPGSGKTGIRHLLAAVYGSQEGVGPSHLLSPAGGDYKVSQRATGATMAVDVAAGEALVLGDDTARQGVYHQANDAVVTVNAPANASGQPRLDQLVLTVADSSIAGGSDTPTLQVLQGTAQAGVTIDNRLGAAALPNNSVRLAEWVTPNAATQITTAMIRDRRPWARGFFRRFQTNGLAAATNTSAATYVAVPGQTFRYESSGAPIRAMFKGSCGHDNSGARLRIAFFEDGAYPEAQQWQGLVAPSPAASRGSVATYLQSWAPAAGSHLLTLQFINYEGIGTANVQGDPLLTLEEIVRPSVSNDGA